MPRIRWFRVILAAALVVTFLVCLAAIVVTGPIVSKPPKLDLEVDVSPERLRRDVERLCGEFHPRHFESRGHLDAAADWIAGEFRDAGLQVQVQEYDLREGRFRNVVGFRPGIEPDAAVRVLGAHYDAYGLYPGADDNASGVAVMLELVRTLPPDPPRRSQYFVAFSTEEPPFFGSPDMGSRYFVDELTDSGVDVDLMIALDLVGRFSDEPGSQRYPLPGLGLFYPDRGNFIAVVGDLGAGRWIKRTKLGLMMMTDLPVQSFRGPSALPGVDWSDHLWFRRNALPGVLVTDTAFLRNDDYHASGDTPDRLDYRRMAEVVRGLHGLFWDRNLSD